MEGIPEVKYSLRVFRILDPKRTFAQREIPWRSEFEVAVLLSRHGASQLCIIRSLKRSGQPPPWS